MRPFRVLSASGARGGGEGALYQGSYKLSTPDPKP